MKNKPAIPNKNKPAKPMKVDTTVQLQTAMDLHNAGDFDNARTAYKTILTTNPKDFNALHLLGVIETQTGNLENAIEYFTQAIAINSTSAHVFNNRAGLYTFLKQPELALADCDTAIKLDPNFAEAQLNRSQILLNLGDYKAALSSCDKVISLKGYPEAYNTRGAILKKMGEHQTALANFNHAISLNKDYVDAYNNRGVLLQEFGEPLKALDDYNFAIAARPDYVEAYANKASACQDLNLIEETLENYNHALELKPDDVMIHTHRSFALLLSGNLLEGWKEFEWRKQTPTFINARQYDQPSYTGNESLTDKTILLYSEQGLGDSIQFARYIKLISDMALEVLVEVEEPLLNIFATSLPDNVKLIKKGNNIPAFDYHCSLMSLPLTFSTTLETIPCSDAYLVSDPVKTEYWKNKLGDHTKLRVGIVWNGGFRPERNDLWAVNRRRNIPLEKFSILKNPDIAFYSLQKGEHAEFELETLIADKWKGPKLIDYTAELNDFSDTAALIENLDLIIAVDTSVAHLAAAIGKPTWILNRFDTCWRWLLNRNDSPWYSSVKLYRQETYGDWDSVIERVNADLINYKAL